MSFSSYPNSWKGVTWVLRICRKWKIRGLTVMKSSGVLLPELPGATTSKFAPKLLQQLKSCSQIPETKLKLSLFNNCPNIQILWIPTEFIFNLCFLFPLPKKEQSLLCRESTFCCCHLVFKSDSRTFSFILAFPFFFFWTVLNLNFLRALLAHLFLIYYLFDLGK